MATAGTAIERAAAAITTLPSASPLARLEQAKTELEYAATVDEVKDIRDKVEALRLYAKQAQLGLVTQNLCAEVKLRAERRAGEMLAAADLRPGPKPIDDTLSSIGVQPHQSSRWQRIARIPEPKFEEYVGAFMTGDATRELTTVGALKLAKQLTAESIKTTPRVVDWSARDRAPESFTTIVADPPWQYDNVATRGAAEDHYPTMTMAELLKLDIDNLEDINGIPQLRVPTAKDAHLYLWVTNGFLREGFDLMDAWGFTYKACLTWVKPQIGLGNYFRNATEHVLFGVRGRLPTLRDDVPTWFEADRTRHSAKPPCFYDLVESSSDGPYLEMFAREQRLNPNWCYWGNEA